MVIREYSTEQRRSAAAQSVLLFVGFLAWMLSTAGAALLSDGYTTSSSLLGGRSAFENVISAAKKDPVSAYSGMVVGWIAVAAWSIYFVCDLFSCYGRSRDENLNDKVFRAKQWGTL